MRGGIQSNSIKSQYIGQSYITVKSCINWWTSYYYWRNRISSTKYYKWNYYFREGIIQQFSAALSLIVIVAGGLFDYHYRTVLYKVEKRGELLEYFLGFNLVGVITNDRFLWFKSWGFVFFYIGVTVVLGIIASPLFSEII